MTSPVGRVKSPAGITELSGKPVFIRQARLLTTLVETNCVHITSNLV